MTFPEPHNRFHIVLVEPEDNINIGSVARAMMNLGFSKLHLVAPRRWDLDRASISARWAIPILKAACIHDTMEAALGGMNEVVGFTGRGGKNREPDFGLEGWLGRLQMNFSGETALVFGPEDHGLTKEHVTHCRWLIRIPSSDEYPAYNLAQAVLLSLFEVNRVTRGLTADRPARELPEWNSFYQLNRMVESIAERCGYLRESTPASVPDVIKNLVQRLEPDEREMRILLGLFSRIDGTLSGKYPQEEARAAGR